MTDSRDENYRDWEDRLKISPCIFCGAEVSLQENIPTQNTGTCEGLYPRAYWVECLECGARGPNLDREHALSEWEELASRL